MSLRLANQVEPIPGYRLIERIGRGGYGEVWKAEAPGGVLKAIKFVYGDLESNEAGVPAEQELKALSRVKAVRHPYILSLDRYDIVDGQLVIVMELADRNLWDRFLQCRAQGLPGIPRAELLGYMEETAEALDLMNLQHQLQHRDVKPQNLFLVFNHVKVADFGLVKVLEGMVSSVTGGVTPAYAAPETFDGVVSRFSDQYSLAVVYQELLTGQRPFNGTNARQLLLQHIQKMPDLEPLPPGDRQAIARALAKKSDERYPSCGELVRALGAGQVQEAAAAAARTTVADAGAQRDTDRGAATDESPVVPGRPATSGPALAGRAAVTPTPTPTPQQALPRPDEPPVTCVHAPQAEPSQPAVPEVQGDGLLFPALVIGVGQLALGALKRMREGLHDRFGTLEALPQLRMLYIDTDPDGLTAAVQGTSGAAFLGHEILLARLYRPSHYLKSDEDRAFIDSWLDSELLYRIPRVPVTTGMRALGRLAFCDNHQAIAKHVKEDLQACGQRDGLDKAAKKTGLGWRSSRPRVYLVTSLTGGTGSGMFVDLAYLVRAQLKQLGHEGAEVIGVLLVPTVDRTQPRAMALGNSLAALTELNHYSSPHVTFSARYGLKAAPVSDSAAPFDRCVLLPLAPRADEEAAQDIAALAGGLLYRELVTPLGRTAEVRRAEVLKRAALPGKMACQNFGVHRLVWPRRTMVRATAQRLCQRLLESWTDKNSTHVAEPVQAWLTEQWSQREFGPDSLIARFQEACRARLNRTAEEAFAAVIAPLGGAGAQGSTPDAASAAGVSDQIIQLVGQPNDDVELLGTNKLRETLARAAPEIMAAWEQKLAELAVGLMERPGFRLGGAEEAIRQVTAMMQQAVHSQELLCQELAGKAAEAFTAIQAALGNTRKSWTGARLSPASDLVELLAFYAQTQYQRLVLQRVCMVYRSLMANGPELLHEIGFCRDRLTRLLRGLENASTRECPEVDLGRGRLLFPAGLRTLDQAMDQVLASVTPEEFTDFDQRIQAIVQREFQSLVQICTDPRDPRRDFQVAMLQEAEAFIDKRLSGLTAADVYLSNKERDLADDILMIHDEAVPELAPARRAGSLEVAIAAIPAPPPSPSPKLGEAKTGGEGLQALLRRALPNVEVIPADRANEILLYREQPHIALSDLPQLGPVAREAYRQMAAVEHFTPHSRTDITDWLPLGGNA